MASSTAGETCGLSAIVAKKSPGASCSSRNVSAEIPRRSGIVCSSRRSRYVLIQPSVLLPRVLVEERGTVPQEARRHRARVHVAEPVPDRELELLHRKPDDEALVVQDLRHLP